VQYLSRLKKPVLNEESQKRRGKDQVAETAIEKETNQVERVPVQLPGWVYWLIVRNENLRMEILTIGLSSGEEALPIFSYEDEADMFLGVGEFAGSWQARKTMTGELISVLYGPCALVKKVVLDPLPEMVADRTVGLLSLGRDRFVDHILARERSSSSSKIQMWHRCEQSTEAGATCGRSRPPT
jgi:hypothetical protein